MEIVYKRVEDLIPYENNPRRNASAVDAVARSIEAFGFKVPIVIDEENVIIAGHTRLLASEQLGLEEVPCVIAGDLTEEQARAFRLADNKVAELATWDADRLAEELAEIEMDMEQFGFISDVEMDFGETDVEFTEKPKKPHKCPHCGYEWEE